MIAPRAFGGRALCLLGVLLGVLAACCSKKAPVTPPEPVPPGEVRVIGNRIVWSTERESRASVRYGYSANNFDHMAYPDAANRQDRAFTTGEHSVALLDLRPGQTVWFQAVSEATNAGPAYSPLTSFTVGSNTVGPLLTSTMLHIGFGDAHVLRMPSTGRIMVMDGGDREATNAVASWLTSRGVTQVDAMLATHIHIDHLGGIVGNSVSDTDGLVRLFPPTYFFDSPLKSDDSNNAFAYRELLRTIPAATERVILQRGQSSQDVLALQLDPEVRIQCLQSGSRPGPIPDTAGKVANNESIVLRFSYGDVDFVIGGDTEIESEASILAQWTPAQVEVEYFKSTHHGLSDANSSTWINALKPRVAFIPNTMRDWCPTSGFEGAISSTEQKLHGIRADIYVIDEALSLGRERDHRQYNVSFVTDGTSYEVRVELADQPVQAPDPCKPSLEGDFGPGFDPCEAGEEPLAPISTR